MGEVIVIKKKMMKSTLRKRLLGKLAKLWQELSSRPRQDETTQSSIFVDSLPTTPSKQDVLRANGRVICKVLGQAARRAGYQSSDFDIVVEFDNDKSPVPVFRALVWMPASRALTIANCRDLEYTATIELEIRFEIRLSSVFWRMGGDLVDRANQSFGWGESGLPDLAGIEMGLRGPATRQSYPAPVRLASLPSEDGLRLNTDREATPSELLAFTDAMREAFNEPVAEAKSQP